MSALSDRELEVLEAAANGRTAVAIGLEHHRATSTVKHQLSNARRKLGAATTAHAVAIAFREGFIR